MNITEREQDGVTIFALEGRVDSEGALDLDLALQTAVSDGKHKLVLEMDQVPYINSAGLRALADMLAQGRASQGDLKLVNLGHGGARVFQIVGFDRFVSMYATVDEALASC